MEVCENIIKECQQEEAHDMELFKTINHEALLFN